MKPGDILDISVYGYPELQVKEEPREAANLIKERILEIPYDSFE